ncbi:cytochrome P450 [Mycena olivaceomarginata]|nr:cytochrome P450 [Mycena olivaceomarginata]
MSVPIPQSPTIPFLGNVISVEREIPLRSFQPLAKTYGEIFQLSLLGQTELFVNSYELVNEAEHDEPNWGIAPFGTLAVKDMMEEMRDISNQLPQKWERFGPNAIIDPSDDFTRVALDTIAYCLMSHRLNSFYSEPQPEFAVAMADFLKECSERFTRPGCCKP